MEDLNKKDLEKVFSNVRESYRLLYEYQKRVLDLVKFIGNQLNYSYSGGWPIFSEPCPKRGKGSLDNWAWDWLNMYAYGFHFGENKEGIKFEIRIYSDTGFYDNTTDKKISVDKFNSGEDSKTKLVLIVSREEWNINKMLENFNSRTNKYKLLKELKNLQWSQSSKALTLRDLNSQWIEFCKNSSNTICAKSYDLSSFLNEETITEQLEDFGEYCFETCGIDIGYSSKA